MASTITQVEKLVGKRIRRREDPRLLTGTATYVDDIQMPGMHYAAIVRSPHAAARERQDTTGQATVALPICHLRVRYDAVLFALPSSPRPAAIQPAMVHCLQKFKPTTPMSSRRSWKKIPPPGSRMPYRS